MSNALFLLYFWNSDSCGKLMLEGLVGAQASLDTSMQ